MRHFLQLFIRHQDDHMFLYLFYWWMILTSVSYVGEILPPREYLAISGDIFDCHIWWRRLLWYLGGKDQWKVKVSVIQSCLTLCDPMDYSPAPLSMGFSRQEYWSGLSSLLPGDLPNPGIKPMSPELQADSLTSELPGKPSGGQRCC